MSIKPSTHVTHKDVSAAPKVKGPRSIRRSTDHWSANLWVKYAGRIVLTLVVLALWEWMSGRIIDPFFVSRPTDIWVRLVRLSISGELLFHLWATLQEALFGLALGMVIGIPTGLLFASMPLLSNIVQPFMMAIYSLPRVALAPLFILWFGLGLFSKVVLAFTMVVFVAYYNAYQGVKSVDSDLVEMMRSMKATPAQVTRWVVLPSIRPWILASIRLGIGMALIGAVIGEMVASSRGLGYYIQFSSGMFDTTGVFVGLIVVMVTAIVLEMVIGWVDRLLHRTPREYSQGVRK